MSRRSTTTGMSLRTDFRNDLPDNAQHDGPPPAGGRPLHTPLPLPGRRQHTAISFDLPDSEIFGEEKEDDFDIDIEEGDDFDL